MVIGAAERRRRRPKSHAAAGDYRPARRRRRRSEGQTPPPKRITSARMTISERCARERRRSFSFIWCWSWTLMDFSALKQLHSVFGTQHSAEYGDRTEFRHNPKPQGHVKLFYRIMTSATHRIPDSSGWLISGTDFRYIRK